MDTHEDLIMNSCKKAKRAALLLFFAPILFTAFGVALRAINLISFYDSYIGYYKKTFLPIAMNVFFVAAVCFFAAFCFLAERKGSIDVTFNHTKTFRVICAICSLAIIVSALNGLLKNTTELLGLFNILASVCSAAFFATFISKKQPSYSAILALAPIALSTVILATTYFDITVQMNSPNKTLIHFACIAAMLGFLSEARLLADNKKKKTYFFSIFSALFFTGVSSIPALILYFANEFNYTYAKYDCILFVFFLYFLGRMISLCFGKSQCDTSDTEDAISE